jgi:adenosylhomocysteine nucleosidase
VGSADQWNREIDKLLWAHDALGIDSEDMESAAVHQVAHIAGVPFLAVRIISNTEHHDEAFRPELGSTCAAFVVEVVKALAQSPASAGR